jgi:hypothetical protein
MENKQDMLTKTDLEERGWTGALIKRFLPPPDKEIPNPIYRSSSSMKLYFLERVNETEQMPEFKEAFDKTIRRKESAQKAADKRRQATIDRINSRPPPKIPKMSEEKLLNNAIDHYNSLWENRDRIDKWASVNDDTGFLNRITVNYIRHVLTDYENQMFELFNHTGKQEARMLIQ